MAHGNHRRLFSEPRLFPELIDVIIDHLHYDIRSLGACSLVCKTWTRSARVDGIGLNIKQLLESAPVVIPFVRHLHFRQQRCWEVTLPLLVSFESIKSLNVTNLPVHCLDARALSALFCNFSAAVDVRLDDV